MKILFIGDVFGRPGREAVGEWLPKFREEQSIDFVIANAENSAGGKGITSSTVRELFAAQCDALTGGNHTFAQREALELVERDSRILRPANLPPGTPGRGLGIYSTSAGPKVAVLNLMGRAFMKAIDCPFRVGRQLVEEAIGETPILIVDFHAEATSEKMAMAAYLDGTATAVIGTHTHVPTADARVTDKGTAAITDVGMTGPYDSVIGIKTEIALEQMMTGLPVRHEVGAGGVRVCGLLLEADPATGRALAAQAIRVPDFQPVLRTHKLP
jgi:metallophosphoesterase (TIGR00282 family)